MDLWDDLVRRPFHDFARKNAGHHFFESYQHAHNGDDDAYNKTMDKWEFWANFRDKSHSVRDDIKAHQEMVTHLFDRRMTSGMLHFLDDEQKREYIQEILIDNGADRWVDPVSVDDILAHFEEQKNNGTLPQPTDEDRDTAADYLQRLEDKNNYETEMEYFSDSRTAMLKGEELNDPERELQILKTMYERMHRRFEHKPDFNSWATSMTGNQSYIKRQETAPEPQVI